MSVMRQPRPRPAVPGPGHRSPAPVSFGEWWIGLDDDDRRDLIDNHGDHIRALKESGLGPVPQLPHTWRPGPRAV